MMRFLTGLILLFTFGAQAGAPVIGYPTATDIKLLKPNIDLNGQSKILSGTVDPSVTATSAPIGSIYLNSSTGVSYRKLDAGSSTNWANTSIVSIIQQAASATRLTSGSGTYTVPAGVTQILVRLVGGGGGGAGSGTAAGSSATAGGSTTFGTSLITATGGGAGTWNAGVPGGGTPTISAPAISIRTATGAPGGGGGIGFSTVVALSGGSGGVSPLGGAGASAYNGGSAVAAISNSGSGGAGGGINSTANSISGNGGGAGAYAEALVTVSPGQTYSYAVGAAGAGGGAGTSGYVGSSGGSGAIEVLEYAGPSGSSYLPNLTPAYAGKQWLGATAIDALVGASAAPSNTRTTISAAGFSTYTLMGSAQNDSSTNAQVTATLPAGEYEVEYSGYIRTKTSAGGTTTNCVYELHDGTSVLGSIYENSLSQASASGQDMSHLRGYFKLTGTTTKTISLRAAKVSGDATANSFCEAYVDSSAASTGTTAILSIKPYTQTVPMPVIANSVITSSAGVERVERLTFGGVTVGTTNCTASPCTIWRQSGAFTSATRIGAGSFAATITGGVFSATPTCTCSAIRYGVEYGVCSAVASTLTNVDILTAGMGSPGTPNDTSVSLLCQGPK